MLRTAPQVSPVECEAAAAAGNVWFALAVISHSSNTAVGERTVNSEADINEIKLQTIMLDYMHASFPLTSLCVGRNPAWEMQTPYRDNYNIKR